MSSRMKYPLLVILSAVMYGIAPAFTKSTFQYGGNGLSLAFYVTLFSLPFLYGMVRRQKQTLHLEKPQVKKMLILTLCGSVGAVIFLFFSYERISIGLATTLHFVYPVVVAFAVVFLYKEKLSFLKILALVMAVGGIALMSLDDVNADFLGIFMAALSGVTWAFYIVYLDYSGLKDLNPYVLAFYNVVVTCIASGIIAVATGQLRVLTSPIAWILVVCASIVGRVVAGPCFQMGIRGTGPLVAGVLSTFEPITSVVIGILLFGEALTPGVAAGCVMVIGGVCLIVYSGARKTNTEPEPDLMPEPEVENKDLSQP